MKFVFKFCTTKIFHKGNYNDQFQDVLKYHPTLFSQFFSTDATFRLPLSNKLPKFFSSQKIFNINFLRNFLYMSHSDFVFWHRLLEKKDRWSLLDFLNSEWDWYGQTLLIILLWNGKSRVVRDHLVDIFGCLTKINFFLWVEHGNEQKVHVKISPVKVLRITQNQQYPSETVFLKSV